MAAPMTLHIDEHRNQKSQLTHIKSPNNEEDFYQSLAKLFMLTKPPSLFPLPSSVIESPICELSMV